MKVLDKGHVVLLDSMGTDDSPIESARVSTATEKDPNRDDKLRSYLWEHGHTSPFECLVARIELKIPLFVLNQFTRHRTLDFSDLVIETEDENYRKWFSPNEQSARYSEFSEEYYEPDFIRGVGGKNKQSSLDNLSVETKTRIKDFISTFSKDAHDTYKTLLGFGHAREQARIVHTQGIYTKRQIVGNFVNWANFLRLRLHEGAQEESREYAKAVEGILKTLWPKTYEVFEEHTLYAQKFSRSELQEIKKYLSMPENAKWKKKFE